MGVEQHRPGNDLPVRPASQGRGHAMSRVSQAPSTAKAAAPIVFVVDDDPSLGKALSSLFRSVGLQVELFGAAAEFLQRKRPDGASCLVLDIRLPGVSGLDFQGQLLKANIRTPIIFMTGHGDIPMSVRAMKAGAVDFLAKPFRDQDMLDAVAAAIQRDQQARQADDTASSLRAAYDSLTVREREVMALVTSGLISKQVAAWLGLSEITVKVHRGQAMRKMKAKSLADLVRMAESLGLHQKTHPPSTFA
jgi:FixJ family two-component response regulator